VIVPNGGETLRRLRARRHRHARGATTPAPRPETVPTTERPARKGNPQ
jgi:hypothetical protein